MITIIAALTERTRIIGVRERIPWTLSVDMEHFKKTTTGGAVIFGRKTFEGIGHPLPNRLNLVVSRNADSIESHNQNLIYTDSIESAILQAKNRGFENIFICGGEQIYRYTLEKKLADKMILSMVQESIVSDSDKKIADAFFPAYDENRWKCICSKKEEGFSINEYLYTNS